ncbi:hypothetical protein FJTKL_07957 [Diaporthe vaccinii]|uniref:Uncharacterized protein n=1 Tax=Diaporthe vaccinii TaxID=105482 RepID=A0ABR4FEI4_9PEZI
MGDLGLAWAARLCVAIAQRVQKKSSLVRFPSPGRDKKKQERRRRGVSRSHGRKKVLMSVDGLTYSFVLAGANECRTRRRRGQPKRTAAGFGDKQREYGYNEETD